MKYGIFTATLAIICALSLPSAHAKARHHRSLHSATHPAVLALGGGLRLMLEYAIAHPLPPK